MINESAEEKYKDIIDMEHHQSLTRPHMSNYDRAAQFSPFAALTGHDAAIKETARVTQKKHELEEEERFHINEQLVWLSGRLSEKPEVEVKYFVQDLRKEGGSYHTIKGALSKIDKYRHVIVMEDGTVIKMNDISSIN